MAAKDYRQSRPPLTPETLIQLSEQLLGRPEASERAKTLTADWQAFLQEEFRLTASQKERLRNIPSSDVALIQGTLNAAVASGGSIQLKLAGKGWNSKSPNTEEEGELEIAPDGQRHEAVGPAPQIIITILKCTFDANCRNWHCRLIPIGT